VSEIAITTTPSTVKVYDTKRRCWICQSEQHFASSCPNKISRVVDSSSTVTNDNRPEFINPSEPCRYCKKLGHTVKDCYKLSNKKATDLTPTIVGEVVHTVASATDYTFRIIDSENVDTHGTSKRVYLGAVINDKIGSCMCDSGSDVNFMPYHLVEPKHIISMSMKSYAANGTVTEIMGHCRLTVQLANQVKFDSDFLISKRVARPMFGTKWLKENTSSWDFESGNLTIQGYKFKLEEEEDLPNYCRKIMITEDVIVPPNSRKTVAGLVLISSARVVNVPD